MRFLKPFSQQPQGWIIAEMMLCLLAIGVLDYVISYEFRLLPLYAGPIFVVGWYCGARVGVPTAIAAGLIWWCSGWFNGDPDLRSWIWPWEMARHFVFFLVVALVGAALRAKDDMATARIALLEHSQRLEHEIVNISQAEQRRIGQDLHDGLCQYLAALSCSATSLRDDLRNSPLENEAKTAAELAKHLQDAVVQTRDLARELVPAHVAQVGLVLALESLAAAVSRLHGIECTFRFTGEANDCCDEHTGMHLYRIAQEAINNAIRHGNAKKIALSLDGTDGLMRFRVADDGSGMSGASSDGMGLAVMRYRARMAGGDLEIEQPASGGTVIACVAKLAPEEDELAAI